MFFLRQSQAFQRLVSLLICCAVSGLALVADCEAANGEDRIWSALMLVTNTDSPKKPAPEVARFSGLVQRVFGYNQVELIGAATKTIDEQCERWLVPSQNFWLSVKAKKGPEDNFLLDLALFHDSRSLVATKAKLAEGSPLFIRGPMYGRGQLLIVLQVLP